MKAGHPLLDADMATVLGWLRRGWAWWSAEIGAMVPASLRMQRSAPASLVLWRGPEDWDRLGNGAPVVLVDPALCLLRALTLPVLGEADLMRLVLLDAPRILPLPPQHLVIAAVADPADRTRVTVAALPRETAQQMLADMRAAQLVPRRVGVAAAQADGQPARMAVDLTHALADIVPLPGAGGAAQAWWALAGFLFLLNLGLLVWRDAQSVDHLQALVDEQVPAVNAAQQISRRIANAGRTAGVLAGRRAAHDPLDALAATTRALPARAWVQSWAWDGSAVRLSGYKREGVDVVAALRRSGRFADVRFAGTDAMAAVPAGQPFDLSARVIAPGPIAPQGTGR